MIIDVPVLDVFDIPNPHYKKIFDPDVFYNINVSDDEDPFERE